MAENDGSTKRCPKCSAVRVLEEFPPDKSNPTGRHGWCRECKRVAARDYAKRNRPRNTARSKVWVEANRAHRKAWRAAHYLKNRDAITEQIRVWRENNQDRYRKKCRDWESRNAAKRRKQRSLAARKRYAANPKKARRYLRAYYKKNSSIFKQARDRYLARRRGNGGKHTQAEIDDILCMQRGKCAYCRSSISRRYQVDHIKPLARGGTHDRRNLQLTCRRCNAQKRDHDPIDFARMLGRLL